ncbi:tellurium resistance protein TerC [Chryseobacterium sp. SN22]|uniref:MauE/DoxX family redox-associated membrane protein n=1 Tax=Chryseobacterium sp. SN22 TaxID=2606431 RepID=UPI0011ED6C1A|nr:MauE/DoxX family redox-associated membrane protein [Chryseobacterium sp. SN22]KAA0126791.1 tellurium resistance protein TerC [Chryseobacterium sp. SN22]
MKTIKSRFTEYTGYFFILLFCYASISKIMDFENFQIQIAQSPLLSAYAVPVSYGIVVPELITCFLLVFQKTRYAGLYASYILMVLFTVYIYLILHYSEFIPCSCGGILEKMDWDTHLVFNIICILLASMPLLMAYHRTLSRIKSAACLLLTALICAAGMFALYRQSEDTVTKDNGFQRRFLHHPLLKEGTRNLGLNSYYMAGFCRDTMYLGNYTAPFTITKITGLSNPVQQNVRPDRTDITFRSPVLEVADSMTYLYDGTVPVVFAGKTGTPYLREQNIGKTYFRKIKSMDPDHFVIAAYHRRKQIQALGIISRGSKDSVKLNPGLLEKQKDGFFEPDGQLNYDAFTGKVAYVYHYKNRFAVTDKDLRSKTVFRTIDTAATPHLGLSVLRNGSRKLNNPIVVNKRSYAYKGVLFIESDRKGKLEKDRGKKAIILDLYSLQEQRYLGSLSIPNRLEKRRIQFSVYNDRLYIIIENELIRYRFAQNILQHFISGEAENLNKE